MSAVERTKLAVLAAVSDEVASLKGRNAKRDRLAAVLASLDDDVRRIGIAYLVGELSGGKVGIGWAALRDLEVGPAAASTTLTILETSETFDAIGRVSGAGSTKERQRLLAGLFARATEQERTFLSRLIAGALRQGAVEGVVLDAIASASGLPAASVRRAAMLGGSIPEVGAALLREGEAGLARFSLTPLRPILPMLASPVEGTEAALEALGTAAFDVKLDGARIQVHREGDVVRVYTRALNDVTERVPEIVELVRGLPARSLVLDGEAIALNGVHPLPFQTTMKRFGRKVDVARMQAELPIAGLFFDVMLKDDVSLLDAPLTERSAVLETLLPASARAARIVTGDLEEVERFYAEAVEKGHEGLVAKSLRSTYEAGARGASWLKIKPAHTLDLVVLAVERGSGRRTAWLSNLHLGARDPENGGFVMLGKTFKGMTDAMLAFQTEKLRALATSDDGYVVHVRPELVVEVAFNDVQESPQYPGGVALRFARVKRYREDKRPEDADTIDAVRAIFTASRRAR
jgi:DNA ligase-1